MQTVPVNVSWSFRAEGTVASFSSSWLRSARSFRALHQAHEHAAHSCKPRQGTTKGVHVL
eukprot:3486093-Prymnesium_polylepis.1